MNSNIIIPDKCKVGFNLRSDTYTGVLGYVIMWDGKKWRKEPSWESWREKYISKEEFSKLEGEALELRNENLTNTYNNAVDYIKNTPIKGEKDYSWDSYKRISLLSLEEYIEECNKTYRYYSPTKSYYNEKLKVIEFDNIPQEGFTLNKRVGGYKSNWNVRQTMCRVYHPLGFEFEITIENLLYILDNASSIKGKGIEGNCILGWHGKDLVLIPEGAPEYQEMVSFTALQNEKVKKKDLIIGGIYINAQNKKVTYLGEADFYSWRGINEGKKLWIEQEGCITAIGIVSLKKYTGENNDQLVELLDKREKNRHFKPEEENVITYELYNIDDLKEKLTIYKGYYDFVVYIPAKTKGKFILHTLSFEDRKYIGGKYDYTMRFYIKKGYRGEVIAEYTNFKDLFDIYKPHKQLINGKAK